MTLHNGATQSLQVFINGGAGIALSRGALRLVMPELRRRLYTDVAPIIYRFGADYIPMWPRLYTDVAPIICRCEAEYTWDWPGDTRLAQAREML